MAQTQRTVSQRNNTQKKKKKKKTKMSATLGFAIKMLTLLILACVVAVFGLFYVKYGKTILEMQTKAKDYVWSSDLGTFKKYQSSIFYDVNGDSISELSGEREVYYVNYEDIPKNVVNAIVTIEDKRFFDHQGVDFIANVRAAVALIKNEGKVTQGASTITQQLARNVFLSNEVSMERKVTEIFIASEMEKKYNKEQILEFYLNNIYFANGYYGIAAAAEGYFGKGVQELSLSQSAFLCSIPNAPTRYNPVTGMEGALGRRDKILKQMYEDGVITSIQYRDAINEKIKIKKQKSSLNNFVESYVYQATIEALMQENGFEFRYTFTDANDEDAYKKDYQEQYDQYQQALYTGGYRVYTSINLDKQQQLQDAVDQNLTSFTTTTKDGIYELQGSAVCIDNSTGRVVAIVGGRSQKFHSYTLNRAYQSYRQPGSSIKPLVVYTPYFELGGTPDDIVNDHKFEGGPSNSTGTYSGRITVRRAVEQSKNTIAWQLFDQITPKVGLSYLHKMGFKKITSRDEGLAASLGGLTYGTNTLEMAGAYATIENDGLYRKPTCVIRITDSSGNIVTEPNMDGTPVYNTNAARVMTDVLTGVLKSGTGVNMKLNNMIAAGKTGTTSDKKDGWFAGFTPYYTTVVWVGYDYPKPIPNLYGNTYPGYIWKQFMNTIHEGLEPKEFNGYEDTWNASNSDEKEEEDIEPEEDPEEDEEEQPEEEEKVTATPTPTETPTPTPTKQPTESAPDEDDDEDNDWEDIGEEDKYPEDDDSDDTDDSGTSEDNNGTQDGSSDSNGGDNSNDAGNEDQGGNAVDTSSTEQP